MMTVMHVLIKSLGNSKSDRLHDAEESIEKSRSEKRVVNQVVSNAVNVPRNTDRIYQTHTNEHPPRGIRKHEEKRDDVCEVKQAANDTNGVPFRVCKDFHNGIVRA
jgi:hypothetical protein